ncbi:hypothetical protein CF326_g748 [Tilletia indica]|nr:hypothetical protein CF326_g748 [Tilletia indica]
MAVFASTFSIGSKYFINCINAYSDDVWEKKSMYVFYLDLLTDFIKLLVYTLFSPSSSPPTDSLSSSPETSSSPPDPSWVVLGIGSGIGRRHRICMNAIRMRV